MNPMMSVHATQSGNEGPVCVCVLATRIASSKSSASVSRCNTCGMVCSGRVCVVHFIGSHRKAVYGHNNNDGSRKDDLDHGADELGGVRDVDDLGSRVEERVCRSSNHEECQD